MDHADSLFGPQTVDRSVKRLRMPHHGIILSTKTAPKVDPVAGNAAGLHPSKSDLGWVQFAKSI